MKNNPEALKLLYIVLNYRELSIMISKQYEVRKRNERRYNVPKNGKECQRYGRTYEAIVEKQMSL